MESGSNLLVPPPATDWKLPKIDRRECCPKFKDLGGEKARLRPLSGRFDRQTGEFALLSPPAAKSVSVFRCRGEWAHGATGSHAGSSTRCPDGRAIQFRPCSTRQRFAWTLRSYPLIVAPQRCGRPQALVSARKAIATGFPEDHLVRI